MINLMQRNRLVNWAVAAVSFGALALGGCDVSNESQAHKSARDAAGLAVSAGEPRATEALVDAVAGGATTATPSQIVTNSAEKDLNDAISKLKAAGALSDISNETKYTLQAQLAGVQLQLARVRMAQLENDALTLGRLVSSIQSLSTAAVDLMAKADTLDQHTAAPKQEMVTQAADLVKQRQEALTAAQAKVKDLQGQITSKEAAAQKIYTDTDAAFAAAEGLKGTAAMAAGKKAMDDRKGAEQLTAEARLLEPELARAEADAALAKNALDDAQTLSRLAQESFKALDETATANKKNVTDLRQAAAKIVGSDSDPESLAGKVAAFVKIASTIDGQVKAAADTADQAAGNYRQAANTYSSFISDTNAKLKEGKPDPKDPMMIIANEQRVKPLLDWSQAASLQTAGRIYMIGSQTARIVSAVNAMAKSAKISASANVDNKLFDTQATERFKNSVGITKQLPKGDKIDLISWIGLTLDAVGNQGWYATGGTAVLTGATSSRAEAVRRNPALTNQLTWIGQ